MRLAWEQSGVFTRAQAIEVGGLAGTTVDSHLRHRRFWPVHRSVYALSPVVPEHGRRIAAVLACGEGAALGDRSAAAFWGAMVHDGGPHHVIAPVGGSRSVDGVERHRTRGFSAGDLVRVGPILITSPARTFLDLGLSCGDDELKPIIREAQYARMIDPDALSAAIAAHPGHRGAARLLDVEPELRRHEGTESPLEDELLDVLLAGGLPVPDRQCWVRGLSGNRYRIDFLYRAPGVAIEADSRGAHERAAAFESDRDRDTDLAAVALLTLRFTRAQIRATPEALVARVRAVLDLRGAG